MTDRKQVIANLEGLTWDDWREYHSDSEVMLIAKDAFALLKEQEAVTEYVMTDYQPTCKACGFRPFTGYIPTLEWMKERGFNFCPHCGKAVKWNA